MLKGIFLSWSEKMLLFSRPVMPNSLWPHGLQHASLSLTISWSLPKFMSIALVIPSSHLILWHPLLLLPSIFPSIRDFPMSQLFTSDDQNTGISASASVLPTSIQNWFHLILTDLISLLSKGLSGVFSSTTTQKHQFLGAQPSLWFNSHIYWKNHSFDYMDLCWQS